MVARVTRESPYSGHCRTMEFRKYDQLEFERRYHAYMNGRIDLREAFPDLSEQALIFIQYGTTIEEFEQYVGKT